MGDMVPGTYEDAFTVRCMEVTRHGAARVETLFDYFQEVACVHADRLGCGCAELAKSGQAWVLLRIRMDVARNPQLGERVSVKTWPSGFKRLYALREGVFTDETGAEIAQLTSYWVLLDTAHLRPLRLPDALNVALPDNSDMPQYFDLSARLMPTGLEHPMTLTVPEHFIDINGHVNNARYCSLVGDWLAKVAGGPVELTTMTAHFMQATQAWSDITVSGRLEADGHFAVAISDDGEAPVMRFAAEGICHKSPGDTNRG